MSNHARHVPILESHWIRLIEQPRPNVFDQVNTFKTSRLQFDSPSCSFIFRRHKEMQNARFVQFTGKHCRGAEKTLNLGQILGAWASADWGQCNSATGHSSGASGWCNPCLLDRACFANDGHGGTSLASRPGGQGRVSRPATSSDSACYIDSRSDNAMALCVNVDAFSRDDHTGFCDVVSSDLTKFAPTSPVLMLTLLTPPNFLVLVAPPCPL